MLYSIFIKFGPIFSLRIMKDFNSKKSRGFGFVSYYNVTDGINLISLNESHEKKIIKDCNGQKRLIHSLGSLNYLKIEPTNHLLFAC